MEEHKDFPVNENSWQNKREIVQEIPFPEFWTLGLAEKWAGEIPENLEAERPESLLIELDLTKEGYGKVFIKNEADRTVNPTGTMKDHIGRSLAYSYKAQAKWALEARGNDPAYARRFPEMRIPRYSMLTAGNAGMALARTFETLGLPPPKLLLDKHTNERTIEAFKKTKADIYLADLSTNPFSGLPSAESPLDPWEILLLTNNSHGTDLTSSNSKDDLTDVLGPDRVTFYQNLAKQIFKERPDEIYVPYGSGALFGEILIRQRLEHSWQTNEEKQEWANYIAQVKIFGGEPLNIDSIADKLSAPAKPFPTTWETELELYKNDGSTNVETGVEKITEEEIKAAYELLRRRGAKTKPKIETEPSGSAGLALYMKKWKEGKITKGAKIIIVNTGKGIISDIAA